MRVAQIIEQQLQDEAGQHHHHSGDAGVVIAKDKWTDCSIGPPTRSI